MGARSTHTLSKSLVALVVFIALVATACGPSVTERAGDVTVPASGTSVLASDSLSTSSAPETSHQYGTSIDEWSAAERKSQASDGSKLSVIKENVVPTPVPLRAGHSIIAWEDLIPAGLSGEEIMAQFQERLDAVEYGTDEATALYEEMRAKFVPDAVNPELDGQKIRLAGFVAPLTYEDEVVTEFLLVPTFGACIHVPPPPPNQTVMVAVSKAEGLSLEETWGPVWVEGTMTVSAAETDLALASYTITNATSGVYDEF